MRHSGFPSLDAEKGSGQEVPWYTPRDLWTQLKPLAREKRQKPTVAESLLWERLRAHRLSGLKFRRQHALGPFIVDFYCAEARLVVEVDGAVHRERQEEDTARTARLEALGFQVLRLTNDQVETDMEGALGRVVEAVEISPSPRAGRGPGGEV